MLIVILASILARAVNGTAAFYATIGGAAVLVILHRLLALVSCHSPAIALVIKGWAHVLVAEGKIQEKPMRQNYISRGDIEEDLRLSAKKEDLDAVKIARLEPSGDVSFILREQEA